MIVLRYFKLRPWEEPVRRTLQQASNEIAASQGRQLYQQRQSYQGVLVKLKVQGWYSTGFYDYVVRSERHDWKILAMVIRMADKAKLSPSGMKLVRKIMQRVRPLLDKLSPKDRQLLKLEHDQQKVEKEEVF